MQSPRRREGSGVLKEEKRTNIFFFKPRADDYTTKQLILLKDTWLSLVQSLRKNISLSKMGCFVVQSSALDLKKKMFVLFSSLRTLDLYLLLKSPRLLINLPRN